MDMSDGIVVNYCILVPSFATLPAISTLNMCILRLTANYYHNWTNVTANIQFELLTSKFGLLSVLDKSGHLVTITARIFPRLVFWLCCAG